jgi:hypothetical protein
MPNTYVRRDFVKREYYSQHFECCWKLNIKRQVAQRAQNCNTKADVYVISRVSDQRALSLRRIYQLPPWGGFASETRLD